MADKPISCVSTPAALDPESVSRQNAIKAILSQVSPLNRQQSLTLLEAGGRCLAQDYRAQCDVPPHRASAMDGYAIRAADAQQQPSTLHCVGTAYAGHPYTGRLQAGQAVKITTGGVVPQGADAVVMQEYVHVQGEQIVIDQTPVVADQFIRQAGSDTQRGQTLLHRGALLGAAEVAMLASDGCAEVRVLAKPVVAILSTGDELVQPGQTRQLGQIYDANRYALHALLRAQGCEVIDYGIIADHAERSAEVIAEAGQQADVIISTGGVSVGEADFIRPEVAKQGQLSFWKVAVKPGKPLTFARLPKALYFGLPGNPVSTLVSFQLFVLPMLQALQHQTPTEPLLLSATLLSPLKKQPGREEFQRGILQREANGRLCVSATGLQDSHALHGITQGNCYIHLANEATGAKAGDLVKVLLYQHIGLNLSQPKPMADTTESA